MPFSSCSNRSIMNQPFMYGDITNWNSKDIGCKKQYTSKQAEVFNKIDKIADAEFIGKQLENDIHSNILNYEKKQRLFKKVDTRFNTKCQLSSEKINSILSNEINDLYQTDRMSSLYHQDARREDKYSFLNALPEKINTTHQCNFSQADWNRIINETTNDFYMKPMEKYSYTNTCMDGFDTLIREQERNLDVHKQKTPAYKEQMKFQVISEMTNENL